MQPEALAEQVLGAVKTFCAAEVERRVTVAVGEMYARMAALAPGKDGRDGRDGRDAFELEVLPSIDETRRYPRGTIARCRGGLVRAARDTDPLDASPELADAGWHVIVEGVRGVETMAEQGKRTSVVRFELTSGTSVDHVLSFPVMLYRGAWKAGGYEAGDCVTRDGALWHCNVVTQAEPGLSPDWTLTAKSGYKRS